MKESFNRLKSMMESLNNEYRSLTGADMSQGSEPAMAVV